MSHTGIEVKHSGGKTLEQVLDERAQKVKEALMELGVPESQIKFGDRHRYGDMDETNFSGFELEFQNK